MSRAFTTLLVSIGLWLSVIPSLRAQDTPYSEDAVKATYLHRFAAYVEWPTPPQPDTPFIIGVMGSDAVMAQLQRVLPQINVQGRAAEARSVKRVADLENVSVLYIAPGQLSAARSLLAAAASHAVLVVTDDDKGLEAGGVINFLRKGANVRFEVSVPAADRYGLKIDAALLAVAAHVETR